MINKASVINICEKNEAFGIGDVPLHRMLELSFFVNLKLSSFRLVTVLFLVYGRYIRACFFQVEHLFQTS